MAKKGYIFWDSETANPQQRICQVAYILADSEGNRVGDPVCQAINPESEIGWWSRSHLDIDWGSLGDMPTFARFWEDAGMADLLRDYILVAHNANGADIHHIKKSLAAYDIEMPEIEAVDTMLVARRNGLPGALIDLCDHYGIMLDSHHDARCDVEACLEVFERILEEFGRPDPAEWVNKPRASSGSRPAYSGLGRVNGSQETVESVLERAEAAGLRGDPYEIEDPVRLKVKVSGRTPGYDHREEMLDALKACGMDASKGKPGEKTQYLAIGDNVGQTKLAPVFDGASPAKIVTTGELLEVMNRFGKAE